MSSPENQGSATRPYLLRALHDWCTDNGFTPYIAVHVDASVKVPAEYVKNNEIVLNVGFEATSGLKLGNQFIEFKARFGGAAREIVVPVDHVVAIYARENGQGMAFPMPTASGEGQPVASAPGTPISGGPPATPARGLRLARQGVDAADRRGAPLSTPPPAPGAPAPPEPPEPGSPRPSLKRVK
jgi:stringent starvation protein B